MLPLKMDTVHRSSIFNLQFQSTLYGKILRFWNNFKAHFHRTYSTRQLPLILKVTPLHSFKVSWKYLQSCRNSLPAIFKWEGFQAWMSVCIKALKVKSLFFRTGCIIIWCPFIFCLKTLHQACWVAI